MIMFALLLFSGRKYNENIWCKTFDTQVKNPDLDFKKASLLRFEIMISIFYLYSLYRLLLSDAILGTEARRIKLVYFNICMVNRNQRFSISKQSKLFVHQLEFL